MTNDRLVSLSLISIKNGIAAIIDFSTIIKNFTQRKSKKFCKCYLNNLNALLMRNHCLNYFRKCIK